LVGSAITDDDEHAEALSLLRASAALEQSRATLAGYAETARGMLAALPDVPARAALEALTYTVLDRTG
jgi:heptaprenyl diphosphate synthase